MPTSGGNTSASRCKPVAGTVDETRTPAIPVGIPCSGHVRQATGITGFQPREEVNEESLAEPRNWQISSRLEEYKKALQTVARMERLFAKGSEIKRKMRARAGLSD